MLIQIIIILLLLMVGIFFLYIRSTPPPTFQTPRKTKRTFSLEVLVQRYWGSAERCRVVPGRASTQACLDHFVSLGYTTSAERRIILNGCQYRRQLQLGALSDVPTHQFE